MSPVAIRHAETVGSRERVFTGGLDIASTPDGLARDTST